ncbi:MAG TPA: SUF system NifU family Fe-S cluster assembly protein, partial [Actinomycetota bacterium]|nr:SUF system NifU family Fe-S cluster assembly protein [Actinomycetota bacterium]
MPLDDIYKEVILDHYKSPRNKRALPGADLTCTRNNPLCGDEITVYVHEDDGKVADISFEGAGCSISQSSASMMTEAVEGKPVEGALRLADDFRGMMAGEVE